MPGTHTLPTLAGWALDATDEAGVSVALTLDTPDGPRPVRFYVSALAASAFADDLRQAGEERFSRDDD